MPLCCFDIGNNGIDVNNSTADRYPLLNRKSRRKYAVLIKFDIGIPMLARTMSHWCRLDAVPLSRRWNSVVETTSTIRYRIDHFTSPNLSYAIFISLRYSGRHRIDIDLMQLSDLGEILWYGKLFWYEYIIGLIIKLGVTMQNTYILLFWRLPRIPYFHGRAKL